MAIAVDPSERIPIVLESDKALPEDQRTTFYVRPLSYHEFRSLTRKFTGKDGKPKKDATFAYDEIVDLLEQFVVGWENFMTAAGKPVELKTTQQNGVKHWTEDTWRCFSLAMIRELFTASFEAQEIMREKAKN